jgi:hypothetical protein
MPMKPAALLRLAVAAAVALSPTLASAEPPARAPDAAAIEEGKTHFQRGVALFHEGDARSALVEFRRAYDLSHNYKVLYNMGQTQFELQDYAGALRAFRRYLAEGGVEIDAARRSAVDDDIRKLGARVARVEVKANVDDAEVLVDDVVVGRTPLKEPVLVSIGRRKITVQKGGVVSAARVVEVAGGDLTAVSLELAEPKTAGPVTPPPPVAQPPTPVVTQPAPSRTGLWVSLGITGALTAGAVVTGVLALGAHSDAETKLGTLGVMSSDVEAAHSKTATLALVTDILGGTAIAMAAVTIVIGVTGKSSAPAKAALGLGPRGVAFSGSF